MNIWNLHFPKAGSSGHFLFRSYSFPFSIPFMSLSKNSILIIYIIILIVFWDVLKLYQVQLFLKRLNSIRIIKDDVKSNDSITDKILHKNIFWKFQTSFSKTVNHRLFAPAKDYWLNLTCCYGDNSFRNALECTFIAFQPDRFW